MKRLPQSISIEITESREVPWLSVVFGAGPMLPFVAGVVLAWAGPPAWQGIAVRLTLLWGCAIVMFLAGVRRGVSFRTPGGPTARQMVTMLWLFCAGFGGAPHG